MKMSVPIAALRFAPEALSLQRIGAWSSALVLHALAFAALILPAPTPVPRAVAPTPDALITEFIAQVIPKPQPAPPMPTPPVRPKPRPATIKPEVMATAIVDSTLSVPVRDPIPIPDPATTTDAVTTPTAADAFIAYLDAPPPPYPRLAIRRNLEGTVHLRVRVDAEGRPREVLVERSSGHAVLDREASTHVMRHWRFQPATVDGRPATAWARVPIGFRLDRV
jgi:protein TonB